MSSYVVKSAGFYDAYEYESGVPLAFIQFYGLGLAQKAMLLKKLDELYGATDQETTEWALEYEVIARMLTHDDWFPCNPRHLVLAECMDELDRLLGPGNKALLENAMNGLSNEKLLAQYKTTKA